MKQIVTIYENSHSASVSELPRDIVCGIKIVHLIGTPTKLFKIVSRMLCCG
jgi:hypothetical protein